MLDRGPPERRRRLRRTQAQSHGIRERWWPEEAEGEEEDGRGMNGPLPAFFPPLSEYKHLYLPPRCISTQQARVSRLLRPDPDGSGGRSLALSTVNLAPQRQTKRKFLLSAVEPSILSAHSQFNSTMAPCKGTCRFLRRDE